MDSLKAKRKNIKSAITRIYNYCNGTNVNTVEIGVRIDKLEQYFKDFEQIQGEIENVTPPEELPKEEDQRILVEAQYYDIKTIWHNRVHHTQAERQDTSYHQLVAAVDNIAKNQSTLGELVTRLSSNEPTTSTPTTFQSNNIRESIKLPRIQLPEFDGTYSDWLRFRDLFEITIHNNQRLANVEKFEYLQCHLRGDALSIIKHLSPSNDNYEVGWQLIKNKFNNLDLIKRSYLKLLFDQPSMKGPVVNELKRLINNINEAVNALKTLDEHVDQWGSMLLFQLERKLDNESQTLWYRIKDNSPTFTSFLEFMSQRLKELENQSENKIMFKQSFSKQKSTSHIHTSTLKNCPLCNQMHQLFSCGKFKLLQVNDRRKLVSQNNLCYNCMQDGHIAAECTLSNCRKCSGKHNTLLHREGSINNSSDRDKTRNQASKPSESVAIHTMQTISQQNITLLSTAVVSIRDRNNILQQCRVLLDTGSQVSLIAEDCVQRLNLKRTFDNTVLCGIGNGRSNQSRGKVHIILKSNMSDHVLSTTALCLPRLTQHQPSIQIPIDKLKFFNNLILADKNCNVPATVDIILGADTFSIWSLNQQIVHPSGSPTALSTIFGWTIIGNVAASQTSHITIAHAAVDFSEQLHQFWEIEELNDNKQYITDEEKAELHFQQTVTRDETGRYMVRLPFKTVNCDFGNTRSQAFRRLISLENKCKINLYLREEYSKFMKEYIDLKHMEYVNEVRVAQYHLPHHAVFKGDSTTTKLRVVFDGSVKGTNGISLNDQLLCGPTIQPDIFTLLVQFRKGKIGLCGDIEKMYRQILIHPDDRKYQAILWRENSQQQISTYYLKTVTYGTSAAPFLAIRTLKQIALDYQEVNPEISEVIQHNFYVDDLMYSAPDITTAVSIREQLSDILLRSGFHLRKWCSNSSEVLQTIALEDCEKTSKTIIDDAKLVKTLGLFWDTNDDVFKYKVSIPELQFSVTKRIALSIISRIFDPLGWASPVIIVMKLFMQRIWLRGLDWDATLPDDLLSQWTQFYKNIESIHTLQIPRWLQFENNQHVELHGFADSSEMAYAAIVYLKVIHVNGKVTTRLVAAKTKVAPVKQISLPRLELCAAQLVVKLLNRVKMALRINVSEIYGWTDSMIVLAWLADHPRKWKNFVANRTSYIISILPSQYWRHIKSKQNPADIATRGSSPAELKDNTLWWYGPTILETHVYQQDKIETTEHDKRTKTILLVNNSKSHELLMKYSNFMELLRVTAYLYRFIKNCQPLKFTKTQGLLTKNELHFARNMLARISQFESYSYEIKVLSSSQCLPANHKLLLLAPFVDEQGLMRVGGRLVNANIPYDQKHPIILNNNSAFTELLVRYYHLKHLYAGVRQLQYLIALSYWIPSVIYGIKRCVYKCTKCIRYRNRSCVQLMGNLPKQRLEVSTAFQNCGVDFAGPLLIRSWKGRGSKLYKCWVALFVCMATKAIHLELVTELSTDAFMASLRRFISRRGKPNNIFSDNGTNFIGCNKRMLDLVQFLNKSNTKECIKKEVVSEGIQWHFSPPSGSHFGGLWEAGVKSMKHHLYRVLGNAPCTFEEMMTILCQIECCLNSRPLTSKFDGDSDPLTPAHFLIMKGMQTIPDQDHLNTNTNRLSSWQHLQKIVQSFWRKWSTDYLKQMQIRPKWKLKTENLKIDDVVILINDQLPPARWSIGRVISTHPGLDGLVRVVTVKTQSGQFKRPIAKLCPLLVNS